jgi:hypothetical protein
VAASNRFCTQCGLSTPAVCPSGHDVDAAHLYCTQCGAPMPGLCPNGHVVQPAQRYCTVCGIGLLGLAPGPLALPRGPDPDPPPNKIDDPSGFASRTPALPASPIRSSGSHRPGGASARPRGSHSAARRSVAVVATGIANLLLLDAAGKRRGRSGRRSAARIRRRSAGPGQPRRPGPRPWPRSAHPGS